MCLIIYAPKGDAIDRSVLAYAHNQNGDGIGVMSINGIEKFMGHKALKRARRYIETYLVPEAVAYAVHFRWATHGAVILANTHPYEAPTRRHWIMHNGVISLTTAESSAQESDTAVYVRKFMTEIPPFTDTQFFEQMGRHIGWGNKLCIMDSDGKFTLCNEDAGVWIAGQWFSNTYSLPAHKIPVRDYQTQRYNMSGYGGYYNSNHRYVPKEIWDTVERKMVPNPAYKAAEAETPKTVIERDTDSCATRVLLPRSNVIHSTAWSGEDRRSYYEALEAGLSVDSDYWDDGTLVGARAAETAIAAAAPPVEKEEAPIGGDFPEYRQEEDSEDQNMFRRYLKKVAAGIYSS